MNKQNVRKLLSHLKKQQKSHEAARFNMRYFNLSTRLSSYPAGMLEPPVCNTQACLGGETILALKAGYIPRNGGINIYKKSRLAELDIEEAATELLGLSLEERQKLFFFSEMLYTDDPTGWPEKFEREYKQATTPADRLAVAIRRVEHFLKTNGKE